MTVEMILKMLEEKVAPVKLSDDFCSKYKMYDNSGIIINCGKSVSGVLFSLDLSLAAVAKANELGYNLIVTHHPAIYGGISRFDCVKDSKAGALAQCLDSGISVISMHLNFDAAPMGIDYYLMRGLGGKEAEVLADVEGGAYGRFYEVPKTSFVKFLVEVKRQFETQRVVTYGRGEREISSVASFCGAGCDERAIAFAKEHGADVFVSSEMRHHEIVELVESGLSVIQLTHYSAETFGFGNIYKQFQKILQIPSSFFVDERFM